MTHIHAGRAIFLSSDLIRLSLRDRGGRPQPLVTGEENEVISPTAGSAPVNWAADPACV